MPISINLPPKADNNILFVQEKCELGCLRAIVLFNPDARGLDPTASVQVETFREMVYSTLVRCFCHDNTLSDFLSNNLEHLDKNFKAILSSLLLTSTGRTLQSQSQKRTEPICKTPSPSSGLEIHRPQVRRTHFLLQTHQGGTTRLCRIRFERP